MKAIEKIVIASIIGTTFMTLYSYRKAKKENEQYVEPILLNKLIGRSKDLDKNEVTPHHPIGWGLHYAVGVTFVAAYWILWRKAMHSPSVTRIIAIGSISGLTGIVVWKTLFKQHDNPPHNDRYGYYRQLFFAHIIFSAFALGSYKTLDSAD